MEPRKFSHCQGREKGTATLEGNLTIPRRMENAHTRLSPRAPSPGDSPPSTHAQGDMYKKVHFNTVCNHEKLQVP